MVRLLASILVLLAVVLSATRAPHAIVIVQAAHAEQVRSSHEDVHPDEGQALAVEAKTTVPSEQHVATPPSGLIAISCATVRSWSIEVRPESIPPRSVRARSMVFLI